MKRQPVASLINSSCTFVLVHYSSVEYIYIRIRSDDSYVSNITLLGEQILIKDVRICQIQTLFNFKQ